jgi:general L-amino acid transport system ATP-binding protein
MLNQKDLANSEEVVITRDVQKWFRKLHVLRGVHLRVRKGETVIICGPSGSGKSTFIRTLNGLEPIQHGEIMVAGHQVHNRRTPLREVRKDVGIVFQDYNLFPHLDVLKNITLALVKVRHVNPREAEEIAFGLLESVRLADKARSYPGSLSGGQTQRVAIVRALALNPKLMLFDEPTSALDPELIGDVLDLMAELSDKGMTMVVVTHELGFAQRVADRIAFFDDGKIIEEAPPTEIIHNPRNERTKQFMRQVGVK